MRVANINIFFCSVLSLIAIATALLNLGHAQSDVWNVGDAERNLTKALKIYKLLHGENHRIVAATLNYLAYAYEQLGRVQEAKEMLERAVEIMDNNYLPSHPGNEVWPCN